MVTINEQTDLPDIPRTIERSSGHQHNFVNAVKSCVQPDNLEYARQMAPPMHPGLLSYRLGKNAALEQWGKIRG